MHYYTAEALWSYLFIIVIFVWSVVIFCWSYRHLANNTATTTCSKPRFLL